MRKVRTLLLLAMMFAMTGLVGCMPLSMGLFTPIPVFPWVTERMEEKYTHKNDFRTPIMAPIKDGAPPPICEDAPDEARIIRALPRVARGIPYFYEEHRDDIQITTELLVDRIDPPRMFPLVGMAQLHHCHWKCTVYYTETIESGYPFPYRVKRPRVKVVYMDMDHLHLCPGGSEGTKAGIARDLGGP